jgi:hypothetical protein
MNTAVLEKPSVLPDEATKLQFPFVMTRNNVSPLRSILYRDICSFLVYYAALSGNPLPTVWDNVSVAP